MSLTDRYFNKDELMVLFLAAGQKLNGELIFEIHGLVRKRKLVDYISSIMTGRASQIAELHTKGFHWQYDPCLLYLCRHDHEKLAVKIYEILSREDETAALEYIEKLVTYNIEERKDKRNDVLSNIRGACLALFFGALVLWYGLKLYDLHQMYADKAVAANIGFFSRLFYELFQFVMKDTHPSAVSVSRVLLIILLSKSLQVLICVVGAIRNASEFKLYAGGKTIDTKVVYVLLVMTEVSIIWISWPIGGFWAFVKIFLFFELVSIGVYNLVLDNLI